MRVAEHVRFLHAASKKAQSEHGVEARARAFVPKFDAYLDATQAFKRRKVASSRRASSSFYDRKIRSAFAIDAAAHEPSRGHPAEVRWQYRLLLQ